MKFKIYPDKQGKHRWKLVANNGRIVADGGEGYNGVGNARRAIKAFRAQLGAAEVEIVVEDPAAALLPVAPAVAP